MLVNKTVEFFLSEVVGRGWRSAVSGSGRARCLRGSRLGLDEMPTTKSPGQAAGRDGSEQMLGRGRRRGCRGWDWARCRQVPRLGPGKMPAGRNRVAAGRDGSGQMLGRQRNLQRPGGGNQINSKENAL